MKMVEARSIPQSQLTSECWMIQFRGKAACKDCVLRGKRECGGKHIRRTGVNRLNFKVPLGEAV